MFVIFFVVVLFGGLLCFRTDGKLLGAYSVGLRLENRIHGRELARMVYGHHLRERRRCAGRMLRNVRGRDARVYLPLCRRVLADGRMSRQQARFPLGRHLRSPDLDCPAILRSAAKAVSRGRR